jgi:REP element-mobilizing transposase RayT
MKSGGGRDFSPAAMRSGGGRDFSPAGNCLATSRATMARPPRIPEFDYIGPLAVFFTSSTLSRRPAFLDSNVARYAVDQILQVAESCDVEISAYCVMPDHVHILTTGCHDQSETLTSFLRWKQKLGYWYRRQTTEFLWQPGYWDRVLRDEDDLGPGCALRGGEPVTCRSRPGPHALSLGRVSAVDHRRARHDVPRLRTSKLVVKPAGLKSRPPGITLPRSGTKVPPSGHNAATQRD